MPKLSELIDIGSLKKGDRLRITFEAICGGLDEDGDIALEGDLPSAYLNPRRYDGYTSIEVIKPELPTEAGEAIQASGKDNNGRAFESEALLLDGRGIWRRSNLAGVDDDQITSWVRLVPESDPY